MALHHYPRIVTDGLVLYLDAANLRSYPGVGNTWYDLSGYDNNPELNATVLYNSSKYFDFNGENARMVVSPDSSIDFTTAVTLSTWIYIYNTAAHNRGLYSRRYLSNLGFYCYVGSSNPETPNISLSVRIEGEGGWKERYGGAVPVNTWINWVGTWDGTLAENNINIYLNGIPHGEPKDAPGTMDSAADLEGSIGRLSTTKWFNGRMGIFSLYNKALTSIEILQNYNTLKRRFQ